MNWSDEELLHNHVENRAMTPAEITEGYLHFRRVIEKMEEKHWSEINAVIYDHSASVASLHSWADYWHKQADELSAAFTQLRQDYARLQGRYDNLSQHKYWWRWW